MSERHEHEDELCEEVIGTNEALQLTQQALKFQAADRAVEDAERVVCTCAESWKTTGDTLAQFRGSPNFDFVLTDADRMALMENFNKAVFDLHAATDVLIEARRKRKELG